MRVQGTTSLSSNSIPKVLALSAFCASYIAQNKVNIYRDFFIIIIIIIRFVKRQNVKRLPWR